MTPRRCSTRRCICRTRSMRSRRAPSSAISCQTRRIRCSRGTAPSNAPVSPAPCTAACICVYVLDPSALSHFDRVCFVCVDGLGDRVIRTNMRNTQLLKKYEAHERISADTVAAVKTYKRIVEYVLWSRMCMCCDSGVHVLTPRAVWAMCSLSQDQVRLQRERLQRQVSELDTKVPPDVALLSLLQAGRSWSGVSAAGGFRNPRFTRTPRRRGCLAISSFSGARSRCRGNPSATA